MTRPLPTGIPGHVVAVGAGLGVLGISAYAYLGIAGQSLPPAQFDSLSVAWSLVNGVGIGVFVSLEQQLARRTAATGGHSDVGAVRRLVVGACLLVAVLAVLAVPAYLLLGDDLFGSSPALVVWLVVAFAGLALAYLVRGLLAGAGQYGRYGWQLGVDGGLRVAGAATLGALGVDTASTYVAVLALAPVVAVLLTTGRPRALRGVPMTAWAREGIVGLTVASLLAAVLANAGPIAVELLADPREATSAGGFLAVLVVARLPLFLYAAIQAVLLPALAAASTTRDAAAFRRTVRTVMSATAVVGVAGTLAVAVVGPLAVRAIFSDRFDTSLALLVLLAVGGGAMMIATSASQAVLALHADRHAAIGWLVGIVVAAAGCLLPLPLATAVGIGLFAGALAAALVHLVSTAGALRQWAAT